MDKHSEVEQIKAGLSIYAEKLIFEGLPQRIAHLNAIFSSPQFMADSVLNVCEEIPLPQIIVLNGSLMVSYPQVEANKHIAVVMPIVKAHINDLQNVTNTLKMWILMLKPKMQAGDNVGVAILEEIIAELDMIRQFASGCRNSMISYHTSRAQLVMDALRNPHVEDFWRAVADADQQKYNSLIRTMFNIQVCYCLLHDLIVKNIKKLKTPRSSNEQRMFSI